MHRARKQGIAWETAYYTPPVLASACPLRQWCIKFMCPEGPEFDMPLVLHCQNGQHIPALEVYRNESPIAGVEDLVKKTKKHKTHKQSLTPLAGRFFQAQNPLIARTNKTTWQIDRGIKQRAAILSWGLCRFAPETGPLCPRDLPPLT